MYIKNPDDPDLLRMDEQVKEMVSNYFRFNQASPSHMVSIVTGLFVNTINGCTDMVYPEARAKHVATIMCAVEEGLLIGKKLRERRENEQNRTV